MRLLVATPLYPPEPGGPATYVKLIEEGLPAHSIEVEVVKFSDVRHLPHVIRHVAYMWHILTKGKRVDVLYALDVLSVGWPVFFANLMLRKPLVVKMVGDHVWEQGAQRFGIKDTLDDFPRFSFSWHPYLWFLRALQFIVSKAATKIIVPSEYLKRIVMTWGIAKEKIVVIYNGISLPSDIPTYTKKPGEFLIVSAGRRVPWKGFDAIERVAATHDTWKVFIASGLSREETLGHIRAADVFVLNSTYEGLSHVLIEAMTLGTPVVVTRAGGNTELVTDKETGLVIPARDDAALTDALEEVAGHPDEAKARALAGKTRVEDFSVPRMLEATASLLTTTL
jgi:glycosyltransferase involved in cell wall biosynthesis